VHEAMEVAEERMAVQFWLPKIQDLTEHLSVSDYFLGRIMCCVV
jgi:hypothetical protein